MDKQVSYEEAIKMIEETPNKRIMWAEGLNFKGGGKPNEISRNSINDWKDKLKHCFRWACIVDVDKNTDEEIVLHGYSVNDMF